jgi:predicted nucleotidyltransferase
MRAKNNPLEKTYLTPAEKKAVATFVREIRKALGDDLVGVTLFGSKVRGDYGPESDIDMLVVLRVKDLKAEDRVFNVLVDVKLATDAYLAPIVYTRREYERSRRLGSPFIANVEKEGIPL